WRKRRLPCHARARLSKAKPPNFALAREARSTGMASAYLKAAPGHPLKGRIRAPGDKSISHRALILGAMAGGVTTVEGLLEGEDALSTAQAMRAFGAGVERLGEGRWRIEGRGG